MTQPVPQIFDRGLVAARAARRSQDADFLRRDVGETLLDRLADIRRPLPRILDLSGVFSAADLSARPGTAQVVQADPGSDLERFPFAPHSFDAVLTCMDLHWVNDLPGVLVQILKALKPDGFFLGAMAGGETLHELRTALMGAELRVTGGASPRVSPFADLRDMAGLLQRAGFSLPVADSERMTVEYPDIFSLMRDLRGMGAANAVAGRIKTFTRRAVFLEAAQAYQQEFGLQNGRIPATFDILYLIGWAPHESQPQPLKRGSATVRLADILGAPEKLP